MDHTFSAGGVRLANDFRDNLIIDRYDEALTSMRGSKREAMRSENSEDVITWNVFHSLAQIDPALWLLRLQETVFDSSQTTPAPTAATVRLWVPTIPPTGLRRFQKDEGASEVDVVVETEFSVWFIEAKFKSDISTGTTNNPDRDQVLRNIDVGSWFAGVREFYFALLVADPARSPKGVAAVARYRDALTEMQHRPDGLKNVRGVALITWRQLAGVLATCAEAATRDDERTYATRALEFLNRKQLA
jgi:hypothetical protein